MVLLHFIISLFLTMGSVQPQLANGQDLAAFNPDTTVYSLTIHEGNFSCFRDLNCLKDKNPFRSSNLDEVRPASNLTGNFIIEGSSRNEEIYAMYNGRGELLKATVIQRNIVLPKNLREILINDEFKSWTMIGNEVEIQDFDKNKVTYKIVLSRDGEVRVEHFDSYGQKVNRFS
jgi:hypothetical protein